jgi:hypothetical protein
VLVLDVARVDFVMKSLLGSAPSSLKRNVYAALAGEALT